MMIATDREKSCQGTNYFHFLMDSFSGIVTLACSSQGHLGFQGVLEVNFLLGNKKLPLLAMSWEIRIVELPFQAGARVKE